MAAVGIMALSRKAWRPGFGEERPPRDGIIDRAAGSVRRPRVRFVPEGTAVPLLDHFRPPLSERRPWESFHATWASTLADLLNQGALPPGFIALETVHSGAAVEIDVA